MHIIQIDLKGNNSNHVGKKKHQSSLYYETYTFLILKIFCHKWNAHQSKNLKSFFERIIQIWKLERECVPNRQKSRIITLKFDQSVFCNNHAIYDNIQDQFLPVLSQTNSKADIWAIQLKSFIINIYKSRIKGS